ncbi:MAG: hypothetical protein EOO15_24550 [Chitinophagaceae bacterium]|nr:MAG: hypothetical protein EOO15_24550 [Chitinophagaceae bacterium]
MPDNTQGNIVPPVVAPSSQETVHFDLYEITQTNDPITVNVIPGETGQLSQTDISVDGNPIVSNQQGAINGCAIGTNNSLRGQFLNVVTTVTDMPGDTMETSFRFELNGGQKPYKYYMEKTVQSVGETVIYRMKIFFTTH